MNGEFAFTVVVVALTMFIAIYPVRALRAISWMKRNAEFPGSYVRFVRVVAASICVFNIFKAIVLVLSSK